MRNVLLKVFPWEFKISFKIFLENSQFCLWIHGSKSLDRENANNENYLYRNARYSSLRFHNNLYFYILAVYTPWQLPIAVKFATPDTKCNITMLKGLGKKKVLEMVLQVVCKSLFIVSTGKSQEMVFDLNSRKLVCWWKIRGSIKERIKII